MSSASKVPWQLQIAKRRPRRKGQARPLMEELPAIDARAWSKRKWFPQNWHDQHEYDHYIAAGIARVQLSRRTASIFHSGTVQHVAISWIKVGFGLRPAFICTCRRRVYRLLLAGRSFVCRHCCGAQYLSRAVHSRHRPVVAAARLQRFLQRWQAPIRWTTFHRISGRLKGYLARMPRRYRSSIIADHLLQPRSAYCSRVAMHRW
jgi:hypothetical protein